MMPYGIRIDVRMTPRAKMMRCITIANAEPITSSKPTVTTMMKTVFQTLCHHSVSVSTVT